MPSVAVPNAAGEPPPPVSRITLLARPGCHLCDDARAVIERVAGELGVGWEERDITASPDDMRDYWDKIPVDAGRRGPGGLLAGERDPPAGGAGLPGRARSGRPGIDFVKRCTKAYRGIDFG